MTTVERQMWWTARRLSERLAIEDFFEAAVTAAFLIAAADGSASTDEYNLLLDRLELLAGADRDAIDDRLSTAANQLVAGGLEPLLARISDLLPDPEDGEAALMLALATALADNTVTQDERDVATRLAAALNLGEISLDVQLAEIRLS